jgi:Zn-dependent metalloprotease
MIAALLAAVASSFTADFPQATVIESASHGRLTNASGFSAGGLGNTPEAAALAFLARYGAAFGISSKQQLVVRGGGTALHVERQIDGLPVFDGEVVVGLSANNAVILVNSADVPGETSGRFRYSRRAAARAAAKGLAGTVIQETPRAVRGWKVAGPTVRPVWRVDLATEHPAGEWRTFVDAETGAVLSRTNLRSYGGTGIR